MSRVELTLPDDLSDRIDLLVEQGEFLTRQKAMEELLSMGISTYDTVEDDDPQMEEGLFNQAVTDQKDPAMRDEGDEQTF
ncbi:ribbon-helix-helix domain-containing protein [Haloprofundus salinisoli]|uniref:ribbon-helix-helix domain-containing protein n=1 Tax=Haloprofundus salinisoli TaxID=2876193 RepID=UPI001CCD39E2|nr:ribbon-helix-helix domain-containing protein [Haloprofundus salinisoli]